MNQINHFIFINLLTNLNQKIPQQMSVSNYADLSRITAIKMSKESLTKPANYLIS